MIDLINQYKDLKEKEKEIKNILDALNEHIKEEMIKKELKEYEGVFLYEQNTVSYDIKDIWDEIKDLDNASDFLKIDAKKIPAGYEDYRKINKIVKLGIKKI